MVAAAELYVPTCMQLMQRGSFAQITTAKVASPTSSDNDHPKIPPSPTTRTPPPRLHRAPQQKRRLSPPGTYRPMPSLPCMPPMCSTQVTWRVPTITPMTAHRVAMPPECAGRGGPTPVTTVASTHQQTKTPVAASAQMGLATMAN